MRILNFLHHTDIVQLNVQILVDRLQRPADLDIILELDGDLVVNEGFEETARDVRSSCNKVEVRGPELGMSMTYLKNSIVRM
jgi:hypothetical protein